MIVRDDSRGVDGGDTRWMTYAELAEARGIKEPAAVRLVQRHKWERQPGNDGAARIAVPVVQLRLSRAVAPSVMAVAPDSHDIETLRREQQRADQAETRAGHAEEQAVAARTLAEQRGTDLTAALVRAAKLEGELEAVREALTEARKSFWRRWLGL